MKIRIGNDIRVKVTFRFTGLEDVVNIQYIRAFLINTTLDLKLKDTYKKKNRFISRFPIEPQLAGFEPDAYNINSTGHPTGNFVFNKNYKGFGVTPKFWNDIPTFDGVKYEVPVEHTKDSDTVIVTFPANLQKTIGKYKIILVAKIFDDGYKNKVRVVTKDYDNAFELVGLDLVGDDYDNSVSIVINDDTQHIDRNDIYVDRGLYVDETGTLRLTRNDNDEINIDISSITGWYEPE